MGELSYTTSLSGEYLEIRLNKGPSRSLAKRLKELGFLYSGRHGAWRGTKNYEEAVAECEKSVKRSGRAYAAPTLCWDCAKSGHGNTSECPWERASTPVPGWDAERTESVIIHYGKYRKEQISYTVRACPLFVEHKKT